MGKIMIKPPWKGERVKPFIRILAIIFIACACFALIGGLYYLVKDGIPKNMILEVVLLILLELYITILFSHVAITGRAPSTWYGWK